MTQQSMLRALAAVAVAAVLWTVPGGAASSTPVLAVAGRSNAHSSVATSGPMTVVAWSASLPDGTVDVYAAVSRDRALTFSPPVRVNSTPGQAHLNGEQPPRVTLAPSGAATPIITVVWTAKGEKGTVLLSARSSDGGKSFARSALVPGGDGAGNRGWQNTVTDNSGRTKVVWLDHRELAPAAGDAHHHAGHETTPAAKKDGVAMAQQSKLYVATVGDAASAKAITGGVCYCCKTAVVSDARTLALAWRHVYPGNYRDIAFTMSRDGGRTFTEPVRVSQDQWQIEGCPDDGPAMALDASGRVHVAWPTLVTDGPGGAPSIGIFYAWSADGRTFQARQRLATEGLPHHPQVVVSGGQVFVAWDELQQGKRRVVLAERALAVPQGSPFKRIVVNGEEPGLYPSLASTPDGVVLSWSSGAGANAVIRVANRGAEK